MFEQLPEGSDTFSLPWWQLRVSPARPARKDDGNRNRETNGMLICSLEGIAERGLGAVTDPTHSRCFETAPRTPGRPSPDLQPHVDGRD